MLTENTSKSQNYLGVAEMEMWEELDKSKKPKQVLSRQETKVIRNQYQYYDSYTITAHQECTLSLRSQ